MVHVVQLDEKTFVAGQITPEDVPDLAARGFEVLVNNRPDGEAGPAQPLAAEIEAAAGERGLQFVNLPFTGPALSADYAARFAEVLKESEGPVLAYCRTGNRSTMLWAAANIALGRALEDVLETAMAAGYDLRAAALFIEALGKAAAARS
jgi:uncharacterized protein (TIGR01244 family)